MALALGLVSAVAIVVSIAVNDTGIVKANVAYISALIAQILSFIWHSLCFSRQTFYR